MDENFSWVRFFQVNAWAWVYILGLLTVLVVLEYVQEEPSQDSALLVACLNGRGIWNPEQAVLILCEPRGYKIGEIQ